MTSFGRSARQNVIWDEFQAIRDEVGEGLRSPEDSSYMEYEGGPELEDMIDDWNDLVNEYEEIHTENETKG